MSDDGALISEFADDPDMAELVEMFIGDLGERVTKLQENIAAQDYSALQTLSHQLKGSGGGYGFPTITSVAATCEAAIKNGEAPPVIQQACEDLIQVCRRACMSTQG